jgi:restriction system protein
MSLWLIRAGSHGEYETKLLEENRVYLTWNEFDTDLSKMKDKAALVNALQTIEPGAKPKK